MSKKNDEKPIYEMRKTIVTEFEGIKFGIILLDTETTSKAKASLRDLGAGGERAVKRKIPAFVASDPRLPTSGPVPLSVWEEYWSAFVKRIPGYVTHLSGVATNASGAMIKPEDIDLRGTITPGTVPLKWSKK